MRTVRFEVPVEVAFDYLVDPHRRAEWQSSLRRVEEVDAGPPRVGQRWVDVTVPADSATICTPSLSGCRCPLKRPRRKYSGE